MRTQTFAAFFPVAFSVALANGACVPPDGLPPGAEPDAAGHSAGGDGACPIGPSHPTPIPPSGCEFPAQVLDLSNWKVTLPIPASSGKPLEVTQPALASYAIAPWFEVNGACDGVQFRAHTSGATTSGSANPRSELREMNGAEGASWSSDAGVHRMYIDEAITAVPAHKQHVVAGQVHDANDDVIVIRLEYPKLFVDVNGTEGPTLDAAYALGRRFTVEFVAHDGMIDVFYNGGETPAHTIEAHVSGAYFKAGAYTQANCTNEPGCSEDDYGQVDLYDLRVQHE